MKKFVYKAVFKRLNPDETGRTKLVLDVMIESNNQYVLNEALITLLKKKLVEKIGASEAAEWYLTDCECLGDISKKESLCKGQKVWIKISIADKKYIKENGLSEIEWIPAVATGNKYEVMLADGSVLDNPTNPEEDIRLWEDNPYAALNRESMNRMVPVQVVGLVNLDTNVVPFHKNIQIPESVFNLNVPEDVSTLKNFLACGENLFIINASKSSKFEIISACVQIQASKTFSEDEIKGYNNKLISLYGSTNPKSVISKYADSEFCCIAFTHSFKNENGKIVESMPILVAVSPKMVAASAERDFPYIFIKKPNITEKISKIFNVNANILEISCECGVIVDLPILL